jgi:hypothetical protein
VLKSPLPARLPQGPAAKLLLCLPQWETFGAPISEGSATIEAVPNIRIPGGLNIPANVHHWWDIFEPAKSATVTAISYGSAAGHGFPGDVEPEPVAIDAFTQRLRVPPSHQVVTATIEATR